MKIARTLLPIVTLGLLICTLVWAPWDATVYSGGEIFQRGTLFRPIIGAKAVENVHLAWEHLLLEWLALGVGYGLVWMVVRERRQG